ncbi:MAG: YidC/Oxa1 family membrane protein insertase [Oscillospiraceae bacterium]|nr:YidC/Oxa1 family membrane protein insertase [Oscillospiraceae bacterium]
MSIGKLLYQLILGPLELVFDVIYSLAYQITEHPGTAIIFLSLAMNFLVLPLYRRADAMQEEERLQSIRMKPGIDQIKKMFKGDERFMILQTYYRQNNYKPYYALKGSLSLLLEIPFFIAAYRYLSGLSLLQGAALGPIRDLGSPDQLLHLGKTSLNLLPILMTVINIISGAIYTRGMPLKSKIQLYGMALIFLVFLYRSPSGLVFYWTLNNLFSLLKNIFYKIPNPKKILDALCSLAGIILFVWFCLVEPPESIRERILIALIAILMQLPFAAGFWKKKDLLKDHMISPGRVNTVFYACCIFLTVLLGILIPSAVIRESPGEFVEMTDFHSPLRYLVSSALLAAGTFLLWCGIFYRLSSSQGKRSFSLAAVIVSGTAVIDYMFFGKNYGNLSSLLKYDFPILNSASSYLINTGVLLAAGVLLYLLWRKKPDLIGAVCIAGCLAVTAMSVLNIQSANRQIKTLQTLAGQQPQEGAQIPLSKTGKNVIVIMLDRAVNAFVPYVLNERPELQRQFAGFTYYPNTLSYGARTNVGSPPLFGGYDYIPEEIDRRSDVLLKDKQNEALKIMPVNFYENGYEVTVCDPSLANYMWTPDLSIFDDYPGMHTYNTIGRYTGYEEETLRMEYAIWNRNFFCFSVFKAAPLLLQDDLYDEGIYLSSKNSLSIDTPQVAASPSVSRGVDLDFLKNYAVLNHLPELTRPDAAQENTFLMMSNEITHVPMLTQTPDYIPQNEVDNTAYDEKHAVRVSLSGEELQPAEDLLLMTHYHALMAAFIQLGNWFDYLRENDVWDNTRIILVSDHGFYFGEYFNMVLEAPSYYKEDKGEYYLNLLAYNPLLMVKDFGSRDFTTDTAFMTNADTPLQAFDGLIETPVNPFLNTPITDERKYAGEQHILYRDWSTADDSNRYSFEDVDESRSPKRWLTLRNSNIFDLNNWTVEQK